MIKDFWFWFTCTQCGDGLWSHPSVLMYMSAPLAAAAVLGLILYLERDK